MNLKKIVGVTVLVFAFLLSPVSQVFGVEAETSAGATVTPMKARSLEFRAEMEAKRSAEREKMEERRNTMQDKRASTSDRMQDKRDNMQERKASSTERRIEFQQNIAKRQVEHVSRVMRATIERLEKIIVRIESRMDKIKAEGGDTSSSEEHVALAKADLQAAELKIDAFVNIDLSSDKAKDNFERVRSAAKEVKDLIHSAREHLSDAVRSIVPAKANVEVEVSN